MTKQTVNPNLWHRVLGLLSHPAWNGLSCFFTALGTFGVGSIALAYILGLFDHTQDIFAWLFSPVLVPMVVPLSAVVVVLAVLATSIYRYSSSRVQRKKQESNLSASGKLSPDFEPSDVDIEMMKYLAMAKEAGKYWLEVSFIAQRQKLTKVRADYFLRILEKHGFIHQHKIDGTWGIKDRGIDYLIERHYL